MCCDNYVEFKHYVNEFMKSVSPHTELSKSLSVENKFLKSKIKLLEEEIKKLKNENTALSNATS